LQRPSKLKPAIAELFESGRLDPSQMQVHAGGGKKLR
jgi:hypothetical protein